VTRRASRSGAEGATYRGSEGYLRFVIQRQPPEVQIVFEEAVKIARQHGVTNGYAIVQAMAVEFVTTWRRSGDDSAGGTA